MKRIAVLITCNNRKDKTISCLKSLFKAYNVTSKNFGISVYLTDDASTDGTSEAVQYYFPQVNILAGTGSLYWAGGMRNSWNVALKTGFDGYLLLNDDTILESNIFFNIRIVDEFSLKQFGKRGIYVGSTIDKSSNIISYGGSIVNNKFLFSTHKIIPTGKIEICDLGNANIMYVSNDVVETIGILNRRYRHGVADYDYTLTAKKSGVPVLVMPTYCGKCINDHVNRYHIFNKLSIINRIKFLFAPTGLAFNDNVLFMYRNFPYRLPFIFLAACIKVLFPILYKLRQARH